MRFKFLTIAFLLIGVLALAQKREIKDAKKATEAGDFSKAKSLLQKVEPQISSQRDRTKADFYMAKGSAYLGKNGRGVSVEDLTTAGESFQKAIKFGEKEDGEKGVKATQRILVNGGIASQNAKHFDIAYKKMYAAYEIKPKDTIYLLAAANSALNGQINDKAIEYYEKLKKMGYIGSALQYIATEKATGEIRVFANKSKRDIFMKSGNYVKPTVRRSESKMPEIIKHLALLYLQQGNEEKAMQAINEAKQSNPDDVQLMMAEASIYNKMGKNDKYQEIIKKVIEKDPENATLYYNLGVTSYQMDKPEEAEKYYEKAIEYNPKMAVAYSAIGGIILDKQKAIVDTMNTLGMSNADTKKYNKLSKKRNALIEKALPYMENAYKNDPDNVDVIRTLYQLNIQLGNKEEAQKYKSLMHQDPDSDNQPDSEGK